MLEWLVTAVSYMVVFWAGFFLAAAMAMGRDADAEPSPRLVYPPSLAGSRPAPVAPEN